MNTVKFIFKLGPFHSFCVSTLHRLRKENHFPATGFEPTWKAAGQLEKDFKMWKLFGYFFSIWGSKFPVKQLVVLLSPATHILVRNENGAVRSV